MDTLLGFEMDCEDVQNDDGQTRVRMRMFEGWERNMAELGNANNGLLVIAVCALSWFRKQGNCVLRARVEREEERRCVAARLFDLGS